MVYIIQSVFGLMRYSSHGFTNFSIPNFECQPDRFLLFLTENKQQANLVPIGKKDHENSEFVNTCDEVLTAEKSAICYLLLSWQIGRPNFLIGNHFWI